MDDQMVKVSFTGQGRKSSLFRLHRDADFHTPCCRWDSTAGAQESESWSQLAWDGIWAL